MNKENCHPLITDFFNTKTIDNKNALKPSNRNDLLLSNQSPLSKQKTEKSSPISTNESDIPFEIPEIEFNKIINEFSLDSPVKLLNRKRGHFKKIPTLHDNRNNFIFYKHKHTTTKKKISVLSYNILHQLYMKKYNRPDLSVDNRMKKIRNEILSLSPDIFCLQEADSKIYHKFFSSECFAEYSTVYGINCGSCFINVVGFKNKKFCLKSFKNFSLLSLGKLAGNRGVMNVQLEHEQYKEMISIYNVHLPWKYEKDRFTIMTMIYDHLKETETQIGKHNVFIVGDFNSEPHSDTIKLFYLRHFLKEQKEKEDNEKNCVNYKLLQLADYVYNHYKLKSAYQSYTKEGNNEFLKFPLFTTKTQFYKKTIDYIFFSNKLKVHKILKLPSEEDVNKEKFLPSAEFPSDHLKLYAEFYFKK